MSGGSDEEDLLVLITRWKHCDESETCTSLVFCVTFSRMQIYNYGLQPYYGYSNQDAVELIRTHQLLTCPVGCPPRLYALLVECWHRVPSARPHFSVIRNRLRYCAADTGSGSASGGSAATAGCCGTDALYQPHPICPPAACLQYDDGHTEVYAGHEERYNTAALREDCSASPMMLAPNGHDDALLWSPTANGDAAAIGTDVVVTRSKQASSAVGCSRPSTVANRSTTSTTASTRNSHHPTRSSSSSASDAKSRGVTSSELDRLTSHPRPR